MKPEMIAALVTALVTLCSAIGVQSMIIRRHQRALRQAAHDRELMWVGLVSETLRELADMSSAFSKQTRTVTDAAHQLAQRPSTSQAARDFINSATVAVTLMKNRSEGTTTRLINKVAKVGPIASSLVPDIPDSDIAR